MKPTSPTGWSSAVLTKGGITTVQSATGDFEEQEDADSSFPAEDIGLLKEDLYLFLNQSRGETCIYVGWNQGCIAAGSGAD